jgi:hypothetical protein
VIVLGCAVASTARADPEYHLTGGVELGAGANVWDDNVRLHALAGIPLGHGFDAAAGLTFSSGNLHLEQLPGHDETELLLHLAYGPEAQLGLTYSGVRVFGSFALVRDDVIDRWMVGPVPDVTSGFGWRAGAGVNWAHTIPYDRPGAPFAAVVAATIFPQQLELTTEHDAGSRRFGVAFSWGF